MTNYKYIRNFFIAIIFIGVIAFLFDTTTPDECKVPTEQLSQFCIDLLYP